MPSFSPLFRDLPSAVSDRLEQIVCRFEQAWRQGGAPTLDDYLHAEPAERLALLIELIHTDLEYRLKRGEAVRVESYLQRHPELAEDAQVALGLIEAEYRLRLRTEPALAVADYQCRFPHWHSELGARLPLPTCLCAPAAESTPSVRAGADTSEQPAAPGPGNARAWSFEGYQWLDEVGRGGMAEVWRARDLDLDRTLAIKVLQPRFRGDPELERRFREEARITGQLQHPGIPPVHQVGTLPDGRPFFAMKLIRGHTLAHLLEARPRGANATPLADDLPRFLGIFEAVCQTMAYAHSRGVIHRDLKPGNIMVGAFGEVQVMDWGLAKVLDQTSQGRESQEESPTPPGAPVPGSPAQTQPGAVMGTLTFMAPEQARGEVEQLDERCDVFGLGAILCVILTGQPPYRGDKRTEVQALAARGELADALALLDACGAEGELLQLARRCLAAKKEDRPRDAAEVAAALGRYLAGVQERLRQAERQRTAAEARADEAVKKAVAERRARRLLLGLAAAVVGGMLASGTVVWLVKQQHETKVQADLEQRARQMQADRDALGVLNRAGELLADSWKVQDEAKLALVKAEADRAVDLAAGGTATVQEQAAAFQRDAERRLRRARKSTALRNALLEASLPPEITLYKERGDGSGQMMAHALPSLDEQYATAFRSWDNLDVDRLDEAEVVKRLQQEPEVVVQDVIAALDKWMLYRREVRPEAQWRRLFRLASLLDRNDQRRQLRTLLVGVSPPPVERVAGLPAMRSPWPALWELGRGYNWQRLEELRRHLNPATEPVLTVLLLAQASRAVGDLAGAEGVLRQALARRPDQLVLLDALGRLLERQGSSRLREVIECCRAVRAREPRLGVTLGRALVQAGQFHEGLAVLHDLIRQQPDNPELRLQLGYALERQSKWDEALITYRKAIQLNPDNAEAHNSIGIVLHAQKKPTEAEAAFRKALKLQPDHAFAQNNLGVLLYEQKNLAAAETAFRKVILLKPDYAEAHSNLSLTLCDQNRLDEAEAACRHAILLKPDLASAHYNLGIVLKAKGKLDQAIECYHKALALDPRFVSAHYNLGNIFKAKGKLDQAIQCYQRAIALDPKDAGIHTNLGLALQNKGKADEAIASFQKAIALDPRHANAHTNLGIALQDRRKLDEAIACFKKALQIDPRFAKAHACLGNALQARGKVDEAIACFKKALQIDPRFAKAHACLGDALRDRGKTDEAFVCYQKAIALDPRNAPAHISLGAILCDVQRDYQGAIACFRKAIEIDPRAANAHFNLGNALRARGKVDEAIASFQKAIALDPRHALAHAGLGLALQDRRKLDEAIECYQKAIAIDPRSALIHYNLGVALRQKGKVDEAIACFKKAIQIHPTFAHAYATLASALRSRGKVDEAIACYRKVIEIDPRNAHLYGLLGQALMQQGALPEAQKALRRSLALLPAGHPLQAPVSRLVRQCQRWIDVDDTLKAFLAGQDVPSDAAVLGQMASLAQQPFKQRYLTAARLYCAAFVAEPTLAENVPSGARYNAACAAALAGCGKGERGRWLSEQQRVGWRLQARDWLRADLSWWAKGLDSGNAQDRAVIAQKMQQWQRDTDLAGVRDRDALDRLPEVERQQWQKLWADVAALLRKASAPN
jgi:tetratricopeptide (TPR) repeat protein